MARTTLRRLKKLQSKTNPRITAATWSFIWGRWSTARRRLQKQMKCVICQDPSSKDEADHYPYCGPMRRWAAKALGIDPVELGNRHAWTLTLPTLDDDDKLMATGIWIYVTYRCFNHQRTHGSSLQDDDLNRALNQWMKEAAKNTPLVGKFLKQRWLNNDLEKDGAISCSRAKQRRKQVAAT